MTEEPEPKQFQVVRDYLDARDKSERAAALAKRRKERFEEAERKVLDLFQAEGVPSVRIGRRLVSLTRTLWASARKDQTDDLIAAMRAHGYDDLVSERVLAQTLSAWVRERDEDDEPIPEDILQHLNVAEKFGLSLTKR